MSFKVERDNGNGNILQIVNEDPLPNQPAVQRFGLPASGHGTSWFPLVIEYPEDYFPRFPTLLGPSLMELDPDNTVHQRFPNADFSPAKMRQALILEAKMQANVNLAQTDWYVIRYLDDTGKTMPAKVRDRRNAIRAWADQIEQEINQAPDEALPDYITTIPIELREAL